MSALKIPKQYEKGLIRIFELPLEQVQLLAAALSETQLALNPSLIAAALASKVKSVSESDIELIVRTITSLSITQRALGFQLQKFIEQVLEAISESFRDLAISTPEGQLKLSENLQTLLTIGSLAVTTKATELLHEHQFAFSQARIVSDIRPVFADTVTDGLKAAVIIHMLKITYLSSGDFKELYVALDDSDLKTIKEQIVRAEEKAQSLRTLLSNANVPCIYSE
jgi:hypothetical protein